MVLKCKQLGKRSAMRKIQPIGHFMDMKVGILTRLAEIGENVLFFVLLELDIFILDTMFFLSMMILGNTFDLKLVSTGEDGIEEMIEDLNANKILYAFIKGSKILFIHFLLNNLADFFLPLLNHKFT